MELSEANTSSRRRGPDATVAFVVGATAGHVYPALAVAEALRDAAPSRQLFVAPRDGLAAQLLAAAGVHVATLDTSAIKRAGLAGAAAALVRVAPAFRRGRRLLVDERVAVALSFGSHTSGAVMLAAKSLGLPTLVHEANVVPGLANRWLARVADRFYLAHAESATFFPAGRTRVVGLPLRRATVGGGRASAPTADGVLRLLVTTGSRGAEFLAREIPGLVGAVCSGRPAAVVHQADESAADRVRHAYAAARIDATVVPFIGDLAREMRRAHVAITRAGAGTLAELAATGLPAVVVPLEDSSDDHQSANGRWFAGAGAGICVAEADIRTAPVAEWLGAVLADPSRWRQASDAARSLARDDAAAVIAGDISAIMSGAR